MVTYKSESGYYGNQIKVSLVTMVTYKSEPGYYGNIWDGYVLTR